MRPPSDAEAKELTFAQAANVVLEQVSPSWTTTATLAQWRRSIDVHAATFRDKALAKVTVDDIVGGLAPLWTAKPALAAKVRKHWERVLDQQSGSDRGTPGRPNPAAWTPALRDRLQGPLRPMRSAHGFTDLPPMMAQLRAGRGLGRVILELSVLLCVGLEALCRMRRGDLSQSDEGWSATFPCAPADVAEDTVAVWRPLSERAWSLLEPLYRSGADRGARGFIFPASNRTKALSVRGVAELSTRIFSGRAERLSQPGVLRAFRAWARERASEASLETGGIVMKSIVEDALSPRLGQDDAGGGGARRSELDIRRMFEAWSTFLGGGLS